MEKSLKNTNLNIFKSITPLIVVIVIIISFIISITFNQSILFLDKLITLSALSYLLLLSCCFSNNTMIENKLGIGENDLYNKVYLNTVIELLGIAQNSIRKLKYLSNTKINTSKDLEVIKEILHRLEIMDVPKKYEQKHNILKQQFKDIITKFE